MKTLKQCAVRGLLPVVLALLGSVYALPAAAAGEELARILERMYGTEPKIEAAVVKFFGQLPPDKMAVAKVHMKATIFHPKLPAYMQRIAEPLEKQKLSNQDLAPIMAEIFAGMQVKGLARLDTDKQMAFMRHMARTMRTLSPADCKRMLLGQMSTIESASLERQAINALPLPLFERVFSLYADAVDAELSGYPDARTINKQQALTAEKIFESTYSKRLQAKVSREALVRYSTDAASAPATEACTIGVHSFDAMLEMPEPYRSWQLVRFIQSIQ